MGSPKSKPSTARPKARPTVSASTRLFDAFNHPLAYSLGLHLLAPDSIIDYARPELKAVVMGALPVLRYLKRNVDLHDLSEQARVFYGGINRIMECLHTIPTEWYNFCVDEDIYPSDAASLIKVIPPARTKVSLGPGNHRPLDKSFANFDQTDPTPAQIQGFLNNLPAIPPRSPSPEPESGPAASSSRLIARVTAPTGPNKKCSFDSADLDAPAPDEAEHSEAEAPLDAKPARVCALREKKKASIGSPEALPAKPKKEQDPDAPQRAHRSSGSGAPSRSDKDPDATKISKLIAARVQQAKGSKAGTPVQLNVDLDGNSYNLGDPDDIYLYLIRKKAQLVPDRFFTGHPTTTAHRRLDSDTYVERFESLELIDVQKILEVDIKDTLIPEEPCAFCILHRVECVPIAFGHGCLNCFLKGFRYCCHPATMSELIKFHVEFADRFAAASPSTSQFSLIQTRTATRLASITSLYNDASVDFAEAFDHLVRHFNTCVERFSDETFATRFSDSSSAICDHLADLVAQFRGTYKSFKNLDMSDVDFGMPPHPLSTAVDVDAAGEEEAESEEAEEEVEESTLAMPPKPAPKPSSRPSAAKPSSTPRKPASKPSPVRPPVHAKPRRAQGPGLPVADDLIRQKVITMFRGRKPIGSCSQCTLLSIPCTAVCAGRDCKECELSLNPLCNFATFDFFAQAVDTEDKQAIADHKVSPNWRTYSKYEVWFALYPYVESVIHECQGQHRMEAAAALTHLLTAIDPAAFGLIHQILSAQYQTSSGLLHLFQSMAASNASRCSLIGDQAFITQMAMARAQALILPRPAPRTVPLSQIPLTIEDVIDFTGGSGFINPSDTVGRGAYIEDE
ncbi:hypothetical protein DFH07DRAFT_963474 [Mycena maculata]|uniref:Uncharacterized protein n=1 Tax=Mycena maculata TaxID=230809 RepID=A0AAD7N4A3_9AGAR|nr:hypothetical protein DFH07DRAFT_963474 [Mycena maculata]